jgi:hypothetical protein
MYKESIRRKTLTGDAKKRLLVFGASVPRKLRPLRMRKAHGGSNGRRSFTFHTRESSMPFCFRFEEDFRGADVKVEENKASVRVFWIYPSGLPRVLAAAI